MINAGLSAISVIFAAVGVFVLVTAAMSVMSRTKAAPEPGRPIFPPSSIWTPKVIALTAAGTIIALLLMSGTARLVNRQLRPAAWTFAAGTVLILLFFRHRKIALVFVLLSAPLGMALPTAWFNPTPAEIAFILTDGAALVALCIWLSRKYPHVGRTANRMFFTKLFDRDPD